MDGNVPSERLLSVDVPRWLCIQLSERVSRI